MKLEITIDHDHDQFVAFQEFNKSTFENSAARLAQTNLASKNDIANFVIFKTSKKSYFKCKWIMWVIKKS